MGHNILYIRYIGSIQEEERVCYLCIILNITRKYSIGIFFSILFAVCTIIIHFMISPNEIDAPKDDTWIVHSLMEIGTPITILYKVK